MDETTPLTSPVIVPLWATCLCALLMGAGAAAGMVYAPISDADLLAGADRVVLGEVIEVRAASGADMPALDYVVWVDDSVEGSLASASGVSSARGPATVTVRVPGGRREDGLAMWIPGTPRLRVGDRVLLFLVDADHGMARLYQHTLGLFHVVDVGGRQLAVRALGDAAMIFTADTAGRAAKGLARSVERREEWPRDLDAFLGWLRRRSAEAENLAGSGYEIDPSTLGSAFGDKFSLLLSRNDDSFGSCGDLGGRPVRRFEFDTLESPQTVGWRMHFNGQPGGVAAFRQALAAWTAEPASTVDYSFAGLTSANGVLRNSDGVNTLMFGDPYDDIPGEFDGSGILALGGPWFYCHHHEHRGLEFHEIAEGDIVVQDGVPAAFAATPWPERLMVQLLAHELGHTLGVGHSDEPQALMQALLHLDARGAALEPDDLAALEFLYAAGADAERAPEAPGVPQAESGRGPFVRLTWTPVDGASTYRIERRRVPGSFVLLTTVVGTEFEDVFVEPQGVYDYRLRAQNAAGASGGSPSVRVTAGADGQPSAPSQLRAYPLDAAGIGLRWQNNACDAETLRLAVNTGGEFRDLQTSIDADTTDLLVTGLRRSVGHRFQLSAENRWGLSPPSEGVEIEPLSSDGNCTWFPGDGHLCLERRRYRIMLEYWHEAGESWRLAMPRPDEDGHGFFSFFNTGNLELEVSVERSDSGVASLHWTSLSDRTWRAEVIDTVTGESWTVEPRSPLCVGSRQLVSGLAAGLSSDPGVSSTVPMGSLVSGPATKAADPEIPCGRAPTDLHLGAGRFRARLVWWDLGGVRRQARALDLTDATGGFELSTTDELGWLVKVLDGSSYNGHFWIFASPMHASAAFEAELEVTDLLTGITRLYRRPRPTANTTGAVAACGVGDIGAFGS